MLPNRLWTFQLCFWSLSPNVSVDFTRFLAWIAKVAHNFNLDLRHESLKNIMFGYISCNDSLTFGQILDFGSVACSWCLGRITNSTVLEDIATNVGGYMFVFSSTMVKIATSLLFICLVSKIDDKTLQFGIFHSPHNVSHLACLQVPLFSHLNRCSSLCVFHWLHLGLWHSVIAMGNVAIKSISSLAKVRLRSLALNTKMHCNNS
jgi:hypothetical protein